MPVITVSGNLGSGAREVAQAVAQELQLDYIDREILVEAAQQLGVSVAAVADHDERVSTVGERLAGVLRTLMERSAAACAADPISGGGLEMILARTYGEAAELPHDAARGQLDDESYLRTLTSVIKGIAAQGDCVILSRGSQVILQNAPETLHVYVAAPKEHRIGNLMLRDGISHPEAERRIKEGDQNRQAFHRRYFKVDGDSPALYDLGINAARIRTDIAANMIAVAAAEIVPKPG